MTRTEVLLLSAVVLLCGVLLAVLLLFNPGAFGRLAQVLVPIRQQEVEEVQEPEDLPPSVEEPSWRPVERLEYMVGPWRTPEGEVLASVSFKDVVGAENGVGGAPVRSWKLTIEWDEKPALVCDLYEALQMPDPATDVLPWRLAYCHGRDLDPNDQPTATRVTLLRATGVEYIHIILGLGLDVYLYQVH